MGAAHTRKLFEKSLIKNFKGMRVAHSGGYITGLDDTDKSIIFTQIALARFTEFLVKLFSKSLQGVGRSSTVLVLTWF